MYATRARGLRGLSDWQSTPEPLVEFDPVLETARPAGGAAITREYLAAIARLSQSGWTPAPAPSMLVTVTPAMVSQYFAYHNVEWGDQGQALNAALVQWAQSGKWQAYPNPDGSFSGINVAEAPSYVQGAFRDLFGDANYQTMIGQGSGTLMNVPGAIAPVTPATTGPARYLVDGIAFDTTGALLDNTGTPTGRTIAPSSVTTLLTTGQWPAGLPRPDGRPATIPAASDATANDASVNDATGTAAVSNSDASTYGDATLAPLSPDAPSSDTGGVGVTVVPARIAVPGVSPTSATSLLTPLNLAIGAAVGAAVLGGAAFIRRNTRRRGGR